MRKSTHSLTSSKNPVGLFFIQKVVSIPSFSLCMLVPSGRLPHKPSCTKRAPAKIICVGFTFSGSGAKRDRQSHSGSTRGLKPLGLCRLAHMWLFMEPRRNLRFKLTRSFNSNVQVTLLATQFSSGFETQEAVLVI